MAVGASTEYAVYSLPLMGRYAEKYGHEFACLNDYNFTEFGCQNPCYLKFLIKNLFDKYERICWIDSDIIINNNAPDIFERTNKKGLSLFNEAVYEDRSRMFYWFLGYYGAFCWVNNIQQTDPNLFLKNGEKYYNTGVFLMDKETSIILEPPIFEVMHLGEQSYINYQILKNNIEVKDLDKRFNRMSIVKDISYEEAYFIHFAGDSEKTEKMRVLSEKMA
jgi:lipopolysaccharide biosynthesis glycosyltransferase